MFHRKCLRLLTEAVYTQACISSSDANQFSRMRFLRTPKIFRQSFLMAASTAAVTEEIMSLWACHGGLLSFNDNQPSHCRLFHSNLRSCDILYSPYTAEIPAWSSRPDILSAVKKRTTAHCSSLQASIVMLGTYDSLTSLRARLSNKWHIAERSCRSFLITNNSSYKPTCVKICAMFVIYPVSFSSDCPLYFLFELYLKVSYDIEILLVFKVHLFYWLYEKVVQIINIIGLTNFCFFSRNGINIVLTVITYFISVIKQ